ncbi:hypothetical protein CONPUDRAFT_75233 [Coniophora puteana RWD-64-598 SS2]|uniref:F-box domain-containing protein n=1 Tax=Coniophora puteana (strain RWD-64-598) TaxID=741705 RepID=A0A5M3MJ06_CONPW|nr:uncharacterized protein CONPUDRAFT_75233 [Coniophora puteana RWD-64-598 SS2]EIW78601.1 hypothetical protein CONPUDRAFT_75233 [Coniophora puteana RWD-64-598 SS2]
MLNRCKSALLVLRLSSTNSSWWKALQEYEWLSRCREPRPQLSGDARPDPLISQMATQLASCLEVLVIEDTRAQKLAIPMHWTETASRLRTLALKGCSLPSWGPSPCFKNLTFLSLDSHSQPTLSELAATLSRLQRLQTLVLSCLTKVDSGHTPSSAHRVALSQLCGLVLIGRGAQCLNLLSHLSVPTTVKLFLKCSPVEDGTDLSAALAYSLESQYRSASTQSESLRFRTSWGLHLTADQTRELTALAVPRSRPGQFLDPQLQLMVEFNNNQTRSRVVTSIVRGLCLQHIEFLQIQGLDFIDQRHWRDIWTELPSLKLLTWNFPHSLAFCLFSISLVPLGGEDTADTAQKKIYPLPQLQQLYLTHMTMLNLDWVDPNAQIPERGSKCGGVEEVRRIE